MEKFQLVSFRRSYGCVRSVIVERVCALIASLLEKRMLSLKNMNVIMFSTLKILDNLCLLSMS